MTLVGVHHVAKAKEVPRSDIVASDVRGVHPESHLADVEFEWVEQPHRRSVVDTGERYDVSVQSRATSLFFDRDILTLKIIFKAIYVYIKRVNIILVQRWSYGEFLAHLRKTSLTNRCSLAQFGA